MNIITTSDKKYLPQFYAFAASALENSPNISITCRVVSSENINLKKFSNVKYIIDKAILNTKPNILVEPNSFFRKEKYDSIPERINKYQPTRRVVSELAAYCTGIKYDTLEQSFTGERVIVYSDVDAIIRRDLSELENQIIDNDVDIGFVTERQHGEPVSAFTDKFKIYNNNVDLKTGGLLVFHDTKKTKNFIDFCKNNADLRNIDGDEIVFNQAYEKFKPTVLSIPVSYKDEGGRNASCFDKSSYIWSGHGEIKDFSSDYDKEVKKYLKVADSIL